MSISKIYFDTSIFCNAFEGSNEIADQLKLIFGVAKTNPKRIVTSELTLAEVLGKEPDAIHVVTAINAGCKYVFTADKRFAVSDPLDLILLDNDGVELIHKALDA